jgi:hypothetical protein
VVFCLGSTGEREVDVGKLENRRNRLNKLKAIRRNVKGRLQTNTIQYDARERLNTMYQGEE